MATRLAVTLGSFKEARDTLRLLGCGDLSESKIRKEALCVGEACLAASRTPEKDVRHHRKAQERGVKWLRISTN